MRLKKTVAIVDENWHAIVNMTKQLIPRLPAEGFTLPFSVSELILMLKLEMNRK